jgi:hypothetical protein
MTLQEYRSNKELNFFGTENAESRVEQLAAGNLTAIFFGERFETSALEAMKFCVEFGVVGLCCMDQVRRGTRPTRDGFQAVRSKLGRPSSVIRLSMRTPILASVF